MKRELQTTAQYPADVITCSKANKTLTTNTTTFTVDNYSTIVLEVFDQYESATDQAAYAACLVRLAGHDFMDFRMDADGNSTGGADGCVNFDDPDNAGLVSCIQETNI